MHGRVDHTCAGAVGAHAAPYFGVNGKNVLLSIELTESVCSPHA